MTTSSILLLLLLTLVYIIPHAIAPIDLKRGDVKDLHRQDIVLISVNYGQGKTYIPSQHLPFQSQ